MGLMGKGCSEKKENAARMIPEARAMGAVKGLLV